MTIEIKHGPGASQIPDDLLALFYLLRSGTSGGLIPIVPLFIAGPGTFSPTEQQRLVLCDTTAAPLAVQLPVITGNSVWIIKDRTGQSGVNPISIKAPSGGWTVENPSNAGNQATTGILASQGGSVMYVALLASKIFVQIS